MRAKPYLVVSGAVFAAVAVLHLARALMQLPVRAGGSEVPLWASWAGFVVAALLALWGFRLAKG